MSKEIKLMMAESVRGDLEGSANLLVMGMLPMDAEATVALRTELREQGARLRVVHNRTSLHALEHQHQIDLPAGEGFETLAGFILNYFGYIPRGGESFLYDGLRLTVILMEGKRIARVKIEKVTHESAA